MGNTSGRNKTHPVSDDEPDFSYHDYGYDYEYDQRMDYDSNVSETGLYNILSKVLVSVAS